ncbi:M15 family metallopeptidase [Rhizobium sp. BR 314]|uniref:M15 family metallopeptidase n=1 Tax=Rhizobium sp. BR 314 TaxID=3040013 RepID=UPI0039BF0A80
MAVTLDGLEDVFREKIENLLKDLLNVGVEMRPCTSLRTPQEQAKLWRQSRAREEIISAIARLQNGGAPFLAELLNDVGPQHGPHVTNALPGLSWHQWGESLDCFWAVNGSAEWSPSKVIDGVNGYQLYAARANDMGLDAGGLWRSLKDWPHLQLRKAGSPVLAGFSLSDIDAIMKSRFGEIN